MLDRTELLAGQMLATKSIRLQRTDVSLSDLDADPDLICQVLLELLGNAAEVTGEGGVVRLEARVLPGAETKLELVVADDGPGVGEEAREHLFEPFFTTREDGNGLGLAVARQIVEAHGGCLELVAADGRGSRFALRLPIAEVARQGGMKDARILIVDDEERMARAIATTLKRSGYECEVCHSGEQALAVFENTGADLVVSDRRMPGMDGMQLLQELLDRQASLPVILVTAYGDVRSAVEAMRKGAFHYLTKPFDNTELRELVARALELSRLERENRWLRREVGARHADGVVAESAAMQQALDLADRAAASKAPVLIQGASGTGKEVIARRLHRASDRASGPYVAVNCKAFAEGVLESELFGHEKGAFTGADKARAGCFERADGGTLFLDEIGDVDPTFQAKILRVVQEGEVLRVGASRPKAIDVRIVSATHRDLQQAIRDERFREDLFFRLAVIPIHLAPLSERRDDILPLARHFLARHATSGSRLLTLSTAAEAALCEHPWPGNVRELENAIERAVVLARSATIEAEDLLLQSPLEGSGRSARAGSPVLQEALDEATIDAIRGALEATGGRRAEAARRLGVDRTTLYRLIKRHDL